MTTIRLEKIEDFPPQTQAFLRDNGFSRLDQFTPMETRIALFAAAQEWAKSVPPEEVPRMPTMEMREAGRAVHQAQEQEAMSGKLRMRFDLVTEIWQAMYDAAARIEPQRDGS